MKIEHEGRERNEATNLRRQSSQLIGEELLRRMSDTGNRQTRITYREFGECREVEVANLSGNSVN